MNSEDKTRTKDVLIEESINFDSLLLSQATLSGLKSNGFMKPSPIQLKAIPMGKCGFDLIIKSKSGTGKTAVFGIIALEMIKLDRTSPQALIIAPTREIAFQICEVIKAIAIDFKGLICECFIGGLPIEEDVNKLVKCHIAVGAPGRIKHLIDKDLLKTEAIRLFVLDEADKLMENSYQSDINKIYHKLPTKKQMLAVSATYPDELDKFLAKYMHTPTHISPNIETPLLLGLKHYVSIVNSNVNVIHQNNFKIEELLKLLNKISFTQCLIFSNFQTRVENISNTLNRKGWKSSFISAAQTQSERLDNMKQLKDFQCRILLSTDLTARGIDAINVDLVINFDVPHDASTYLHRMGRAGRYGSKGICVTIAAKGKELAQLQNIIGMIGGTEFFIPSLPRDENFPDNIWECASDKFEAIYGIIDDNYENEKSTRIKNIKESIYELKKFNKVAKDQNAQCDQSEKCNESVECNKFEKPDVELQNDSQSLLQKFAVGENVKLTETISRNETNKLCDSACSKRDKFKEPDIELQDPKSLLQKLALGENVKLKETINGSDTNKLFNTSEIFQLLVGTDLDSSSKRKRNETNLSNSTSLYKEKRPNSDYILQKNVTLLDVTKLLDNDEFFNDINTDISGNIESFINNVKAEEANDISKLAVELQEIPCDKILDNVDKYVLDKNCVRDQENSRNVSHGNKYKLKIQSGSEAVNSIEDEIINHNKDKMINPNKDESIIHSNENLLEDLFIHAYNYALDINKEHWLDVLGETFDENSLKQTKENVINLLDCNEDDNYDYFDDENEDYDNNHVDNEENSDNHKKYNNNQENYDVYNEEMYTNKYHYNRRKQKNKSFNKKRKEYGHSSSDQESNMQISNTNYNNSYCAGQEYLGNETFISCFNHHSDVLAERSYEFEDVASFDNYFLQWQQQVGAVRDYVQQNIYLQEMNYYQYYYKK